MLLWNGVKTCLWVKLNLFAQLIFIEFLWLFLWKGDKSYVRGYGLVNLEPQNPSLSMGTTKSLFHALPNFCLYCSCSYDYFCEKGSKISWGGAFWNSKIFFQASPSIGTTKSLCQAFLSSCLYSLYSYDYFCDMGAKVA